MSFPRYKSYKESGVEWLGDVPEHWVACRFSRVILAIKDGTHGTFSRMTEGKVFLSAKNVNNGRIEISDDESLITWKDHSDIVSNGFPQKGDLLLTIVGTIGRSCVYSLDEAIAFQRSVCFIRLKKSCLPQFFYFLTQSKFFQEQLQSRSKSSAQAGVYMGDVSATSIMFPTNYEEQQIIAAFLDRETAKIDALITEQQRLIELLKEKRQTVISHAVTKGLNPKAPMKDSGIEWLGEVPNHWEVRPIKFVIGKIDSGTSVNAIDEPAQNHEIGVLKTSCVYSGIFNPAENKTVIEQEIDRVSCPLKTDTLIVSRMNTPDLVGATGLVTDAPVNIYLPDRLWQVSFSDTCTAFIYFWTQTPVYRAYIKSVCAGTSSSMQNLSQDQFRSFILALPTFDEQFRIAEFLQNETAKLDTLTTEAKTAITLLQERRTALISAAVTGKIDVRGLVSAKTEVKAETVPC